MKKSYVLLATICLLVSLAMSFQSPITGKNYFILNGNALAEDVGFEDDIGMKYEKNQSVLQETNDNINKKVSEEMTKQIQNRGAGKSLSLDTITLQTNTATNIAVEDEYKEIIIEELDKTTEETETKEETKPEKPANKEVKYKKLNGSNQLESFDTEASNVTYMGNFKLTAYCPCTSCCGQWGANRPVDENGYTIVGTSSGARAYANHTIAVDPSVIPYGTVVIIERNGVYYEYVAEDCGGAIKNNKIDVYFDSHSAACDFGVRYGNVYIIK